MGRRQYELQETAGEELREVKTARLNKLWVLAAVVALVSGYVWAQRHNIEMDGFWTIFIPQDTAYSPGYRAEVFSTLTIPMPAVEARQLLGPPLEVNDLGERQVWFYSTSPSDAHHRRRYLKIEKNVVVSKEAYFYYD
jgi:hypothetical protein